MSRDSVVGILGGMGPAATVDFYAKLVSLTSAATDQDHPRVVIWADPTIPDRTAALIGNGPDPTPWLLRGATVLEQAGASFLAIPCNTAHAFLPAIDGGLGLPVVHMIEEVACYLSAAIPAVERVGLLATTGTLRAELYQHALSAFAIEVLTPDPATQRDKVMAAIRLIKAGHVNSCTHALLVDAAKGLAARGAQAIVAGCTEIPLGLSVAASPRPLVDSTEILARAVLERSGVPQKA
ncbi:aspartate/glutamate racemase family protein [Nocardia brasiliensis]|uniref:aspartate/glutamate racemase family protein n=1 Tax=Nocardia brasiliensis TaxID=37326 RepID=UPI002456B079|nr:amino acid racemase [Nocardia brasiliensis]